MWYRRVGVTSSALYPLSFYEKPILQFDRWAKSIQIIPLTNFQIIIQELSLKIGILPRKSFGELAQIRLDSWKVSAVFPFATGNLTNDFINAPLGRKIAPCNQLLTAEFHFLRNKLPGSDCPLKGSSLLKVSKKIILRQGDLAQIGPISPHVPDSRALGWTFAHPSNKPTCVGKNAVKAVFT
jgi:hypothetical protein